MKWWQVYLAVCAVATLLSAVLTLLCRRLAPALGFLDRPKKEEHKKHGRAVPVLGGLAMLLAWLLTIGGGILGPHAIKPLLSTNVTAYPPGIQTVSSQLIVLVLGAAALVALGLVDDRWPLTAFPKFVGQFCVAGAVACWGIRITLFWHNPFVTWFITALWILIIINAMNFFDNMDGLAAGVAATDALLFMFVAALRGQHFVAVLAGATFGTAVGFLFFNRPPASIFMGDAGSHFLGFSLGVVGALTTFYTPTESLTPAPIIIPALILGLPIFDAAAVVFIRLREHRPIYVGDHKHISHRFTRMGLSRAQAVAVVCLLNLVLGLGAIALLWLPPLGTVMVLLQAAAVLALISLLQIYGSDASPTENT